MDGSRRAKPRPAVRAAREADLQLLLPPGRRLGDCRGSRLDRLPRGVANAPDAARPGQGVALAVRDRDERGPQPAPFRAPLRGGAEPSPAGGVRARLRAGGRRAARRRAPGAGHRRRDREAAPPGAGRLRPLRRAGRHLRGRGARAPHPDRNGALSALPGTTAPAGTRRRRRTRRDEDEATGGIRAMSHDYPALPLRELPRGRLAARKEHMLAEIERPKRLSRWTRVVLVVVASLVVLGTAAAATTSWLAGRPAPPAVVSDFGSYTPQLGFHPEPSQAVLVAEDGAVSLYATTNREGTYCLVVSAPWKRPETLPDGGTCIPGAQAAAPVIAGLVGSSSTTLLIAGRVDVGAAHAIRFAGPDGRLLTRPIGSSGFFVAAVPVSGSPCANGEWKPTFVVVDARARELTHATILLARPAARGVCILGGPHS